MSAPLEPEIALHPDPILRVDASGRVVRANEAAGRLLASWGLSIGSVLPPRLADRTRSVRAEREPRTVAVEVQGQRPLELRLVPCDDDVLVFVRVATEPPETKTQGNEIGSAILANMSHELRTPLNAIVGYAELLADELRDRAQADLLPDLEKITTSADVLRRMIGDLLEVARVEAGRSPLQLDWFEIVDLVQDLALNLAPQVEANGNTLDVSLDPEAPNLYGDAGKVRRILSILVGNAAKFTREGRVGLEVRRVRDEIRFVVSDTGIGMDEEQLAQLFRPFQQADRSARRRFGGTGLGLALVRVLTEQMGGTISVRSTPDVGSAFTVSLPAPARAPTAP